MEPELSDSGETQQNAQDPHIGRLRERYLGPAVPSPMSLAGTGLELAGTVAVLTVGGWWLDGLLGSQPWFMIGGLIIAAIGGIYNLYRRGKQFFKR